MLLFKFVSPDAATKVLQNPDELSIKFGLPKSYNDPYELFLQPDPAVSTDIRHFLARVAVTGASGPL